jgi:hypothetical protein
MSNLLEFLPDSIIILITVAFGYVLGIKAALCLQAVIIAVAFYITAKACDGSPASILIVCWLLIFLIGLIVGDIVWYATFKPDILSLLHTCWSYVSRSLTWLLTPSR